jgi:hypothetical protein
VTVGTIVVPEVFGGRIPGIKVNVQRVVYNLARISDSHAKVRDVIICSIFVTFDHIGSFNWTSNVHPLRLNTGMNATHF